MQPFQGFPIKAGADILRRGLVKCDEVGIGKGHAGRPFNHSIYNVSAGVLENHSPC